MISGAVGSGHVFGRWYEQHSIPSLAAQFAYFGYNFVPLVTRELELLCSMEVLFLRYGNPGGVLNRRGDLDNRLKTLFNALTMPVQKVQLGKYETPDPGETPFFCLLQDDSLLTRVSVESDTLLQGVSHPSDENDARVVISVRVRPARITSQNIGFA